MHLIKYFNSLTSSYLGGLPCKTSSTSCLALWRDDGSFNYSKLKSQHIWKKNIINLIGLVEIYNLNQNNIVLTKTKFTRSQSSVCEIVLINMMLQESYTGHQDTSCSQRNALNKSKVANAYANILLILFEWISCVAWLPHVI